MAYQYATNLVLRDNYLDAKVQGEKVQEAYKDLFEQYQAAAKNICTLTAYNAEARQTDSTPNQTAIMEKPVPGWTVAVSQDLKNWLGKKVYIEGVGVRKVNDLMNKRYSNRIDVCMGERKQSLNFGVKKNRQVVLLDGYMAHGQKCYESNMFRNFEMKYNMLSSK